MKIRTVVALVLAMGLAAAFVGAEEEMEEEEPEAEEVQEEEPPAPKALPPALPQARERRRDEDDPAPRPRARPRQAPRSAPGPAAAPEAQPPDAPMSWDPGKAVLPKGSNCGVLKPKLSKINLVIHNRPRPGKVVLDSTPLVCDKDFCTKIGFANRNCCPLGPEGTDERVACELMLLGTDPSDGVPGPHWMFSGHGDIERHPANPFLAFVFYEAGGGTATVCSNVKPVVCNSIRVP